jgi:hypothetical protein
VIGFSYRGLAPHKFTPMPGVHQADAPALNRRCSPGPLNGRKMKIIHTWRHPMKRVSAVMIGMVFVLSVLTTAHATSYTFTPHGYNCRGINDAGTIVGYYLDGNGWHGFSEETAGVYSTLDYPGISGFTFVYGISSNGMIVGSYRDDKGSDHGFSKTGEVYRSLDYPQATEKLRGSTLDMGHN